MPLAFPMTLAALVAAILVYIYAGMKVGQARGRFGVAAPQVHGHPEFERIFRAHQNTLEQLVIFVPLIVMVAMLFGDLWAAIYGGLWVIGRILYIESYARAAEKRLLGFILSGLGSMLAAVACAIGLLLHFIA